MDLNAFLLAFMGATTVGTMVALFDVRRRSDYFGRERARWDRVLLYWLGFVAAAGVVASHELNERTYTGLETAIMIFGGCLMAGLTALIVDIWWQIRS
jgi:hypothetical protein